MHIIEAFCGPSSQNKRLSLSFKKSPSPKQFSVQKASQATSWLYIYLSFGCCLKPLVAAEAASSS